MGFSGGANAAEAVGAEEAAAIATDAYIYFYPLVTMEITRRQLTNVEAPVDIAAPPNTFANIRAYPTADMKAVVRPNFDTLYSSAWLDVTDEPVVITVPDTAGRYYLLPMLDMWTDVFSSTGWRTTGTGAQTLLVARPDWRPELTQDFTTLGLPEGTRRVEAPTPHAWVIGRIKTDGADDYAAVHRLQDGLAITPLSRWGKPAEMVKGTVDPAIDMKTPAKLQVDGMAADAYFTLAAEVMKTEPPHALDAPLLQRLERIGLYAGESYDPAAQAPEIRAALEAAPAAAQTLMRGLLPTLAAVRNGWSMNTDTMGVYGVFYAKRAIVTQQGLGANRVEDAIYPLNIVDSAGQPLDGSNRYRLHFEAGKLPPAGAFWSLTLYDAEGYQVANPLDRFALSSWMDFHTNADGSLDLLIQNEQPDEGLEANWLPAPKGAFNLTMRLYAPQREALVGRWAPPAVEKAVATPVLVTQ